LRRFAGIGEWGFREELCERVGGPSAFVEEEMEADELEDLGNDIRRQLALIEDMKAQRGQETPLERAIAENSDRLEEICALG
jgi:hypothetical protein